MAPVQVTRKSPRRPWTRNSKIQGLRQWRKWRSPFPVTSNHSQAHHPNRSSESKNPFRRTLRQPPNTDPNLPHHSPCITTPINTPPHSTVQPPRSTLRRPKPTAVNPSATPQNTLTPPPLDDPDPPFAEQPRRPPKAPAGEERERERNKLRGRVREREMSERLQRKREKSERKRGNCFLFFYFFCFF